MENKAVIKKAEIAATIKKFKENLELCRDKFSEKCMMVLERCIERNENLVNVKDETRIEYIDDEFYNIKRVFEGFCDIYNIDYTPEGQIINFSTFIETPELINNKRCTNNPKNKDNQCFQYSNIAFLYHKQINSHSERISKIKPFINNLNWENINFPPQEQDYKTLEMNKSIALKVNEQKISHFYKSQFNKMRENKVVLLMISDNEKQHYLAAKRFNSLLKKRLSIVETIA